MKFFGNITPSGISPETKKITNFLEKFKMPQTTKQVETHWISTIFQELYTKPE